MTLSVSLLKRRAPKVFASASTTRSWTGITPTAPSCKTDEAARKRFVAYTHGLIRELMTNYGKIDVLWYDVDLAADGRSSGSRSA